MFGIPIPKPLLIGGAAIAVIYLYGSHITDNAAIRPLFGSGCEMKVSADMLNVRGAPSASAQIVGQAKGGDSVAVTKDQQDGFRKLGEGRWASAQFLTGSC
ncbi:SH3 domain-containing protein [Pseudonocardiaceae bacterium YIM PH 21723]|nr:SH3 domain-containing protein [Pseudonocardiaceae bacterium YIM PH 21723]